MRLSVSRAALLGRIVIYLCTLTNAYAFSWGSRRLNGAANSLLRNSELREVHQIDDSLTDMYATVLSELQDLESEPLCHRNAARLLVSHCQILDGKNEATVLTDSGRAARDFVDSYAASLAICDLERGSFTIPSSCANFRETALARIAIPSTPQLHVSSVEIDKCLEGLAQSDSAWNTWVSYRHKALRFCDAARVDNEKDRDILRYQRLTNILARLTNEIDTHLEARLKSMDETFQRTKDDLAEIAPRIDAVKKGLGEVEDAVSDGLVHTLQNAQEILHRGFSDARDLQDLLSTMLQTITQNTDDITEAQATALQLVRKQASDEADLVMSSLTAAIASAGSLHRELESSKIRAADIEKKQDDVEAKMHRLDSLVTAISSRYEDQGEQLREAERRAKEILVTLYTAANSADSIQNSITRRLGIQSWGPYLYCPAATLMLGSYRLPPSMARNMALIALGEIAGYIVSNIGKQFDIFVKSATTAVATPLLTTYNTTSAAPSWLTLKTLSLEDEEAQ
ncbi:unnamed protein product [Clonostachys chloroleuca]|uniref:Nuclear membrane fusion protein Kar5 n=1 Tax=Clonostachys chloroleuca TaxID=1926264 RepID=A0AA35LWU7_9HYPO|nr:unnamed protein product [Clonostachys chloroleuca]